MNIYEGVACEKKLAAKRFLIFSEKCSIIDSRLSFTRTLFLFIPK